MSGAFRLAVKPEAIHGWFKPTLRCRGQNGISAVIFINLVAMLPALASALAAENPSQQVVSTITVRDEIIMRVPIRPHPGPQIEWREKRGPRCVAAAAIAGAMLSGRSSVDFVLRDNTRLRARLDSDCPALDFYDGFYVQPEDHRLCMRRDVISSRMGGSCRIERFRLLIPRLKR
jgi:hypothetical protein